jgi:putative transposase
MSRKSRAKPPSPFRCFNSSPEVIRLVVMMYVRFPLSLRNVEDLLFERGIDICHETVRLWWNRFGPLFAGDIRRQRVNRMRGFRHWRWHLDEMYVKLNGEMVYLWRAVDHEGEILESYITRTRDKDAALRFIKKALKRHGSPEAITTDGLRSYRAAMVELGNEDKQEMGRERALIVPTTRASDAAVPTNGEPSEVRLGPRQRPQPLQSRTPHR